MGGGEDGEKEREEAGGQQRHGRAFARLQPKGRLTYISLSSVKSSVHSRKKSTKHPCVQTEVNGGHGIGFGKGRRGRRSQGHAPLASGAHLHQHLPQAQPAAPQVCAEGGVASRSLDNGLSKALGIFLATAWYMQGHDGRVCEEVKQRVLGRRSPAKGRTRQKWQRAFASGRERGVLSRHAAAQARGEGAAGRWMG